METELFPLVTGVTGRCYWCYWCYWCYPCCPSADVRADLADGPPEETWKNRPVDHVDLSSVPRPRPPRLQQCLPGRLADVPLGLCLINQGALFKIDFLFCFCFLWVFSTQINAQTDLALRYNDISPLENHHCAVAFGILSKVLRNLVH